MRSTVFAAFVLAGVAACAAGPAAAATDPHALFARERNAVGGAAWNAVAAVRMDGIAISGGSPSPFSQLVDRATGFSKTTTRIGTVTDVSGYDGIAWDFQGSAIAEQTLPGLVADNVTQAYAARDGWWNRNDRATMTSLGADATGEGVRVVPAGGSPIDVWFDRRTGLIDRLVAHTDSGPVVTTEDDYRTVGALVIAFHSIQTDATGAVTEVNAGSIVPLRTVAANAFARPQPRSLGSIAGGGATAVVPFRYDPDVDWIFTAVRVGNRPATLIFDSGGANYVTAAAARRLGLTTAGGMPISGVGNGSVNAGLAQLGTLSLGAARLADQHGIVAPLPYTVIHPGRGFTSDGLIGAEFLQNLRITFDYGAKTLTLEPFTRPHPAPAGSTVEPLLGDGSHAYVRATIDGVPGLFLLDTGDTGSITVFRRFADAHGLFRGPGLTYLTSGGVGGHLALRLYRGTSFGLGGATMRGPTVTVSDATAGSFASRSIAGNIGGVILARYRTTFDFRRGTVTFVPTARIGAPFSADRTGISLSQSERTAFVVLSVVAGSPAAAAGLKAGDRIVALNGRSVGGAHLGVADAAPYRRSSRPYTLTVAAGGTQRTVTIHPRVLLK